ncbi:MAG: hypothetical protein EA357_11635 [Micavibrio sp.]|nr:MAG: hypothetical protein EA357_11635 [Micavibrio sp.]
MKASRIRIPFFLVAVFISCMIIAAPASAQVAGCNATGDPSNPGVWESMQNRSVVQLGGGIGVDQTIIRKMDSAPALTCWPHAAQISAIRGGSIFSGAFDDRLNNVIEDMVQSFLNDNFEGSWLAETFGANLFNSLNFNSFWGTSDGNTFPGECPFMAEKWEDMRLRSVNMDAEFMTLHRQLDIATGAALGSSEEITDNLRAPAVAAAAAALLAQIATPVVPMPNYSEARTLCDVQCLANNNTCPAGCTCLLPSC